MSGAIGVDAIGTFAIGADAGPPLFGDHRAAVQTLILPYTRVSPIHIPRRDLVLGVSDGLTLRVTVVESDDPAAQVIVLTGGIGGPACTLVIYREAMHSHCWDYGAPFAMAGAVLWSATGTSSTAAAGSFDIAIPAGSFSGFPRRCHWLVRLDWADGTQSDLLAQGALHLAPSTFTTMVSVPIWTDGDSPVLGDDLIPVEA